jgi:hypothetical protein
MLSKSGQVPITSSSELIIVQADERTHIHKSDGKRVFGEVAQGGGVMEVPFSQKKKPFLCVPRKGITA